MSGQAHGSGRTFETAIDDIKAEIRFLRRPRRRAGRYAAAGIVLAGVVFAIAAHADDAKQPAEAQQQLAGIERSVSEIYDSLTIQAERLRLLELEIAVIQRRCTGAEPRPPVWSEPER
jgi:hypothetical protein